MSKTFVGPQLRQLRRTLARAEDATVGCPWRPRIGASICDPLVQETFQAASGTQIEAQKR